MATTRHGLVGWGVRLAGSFAGKMAATPAHNFTGARHGLVGWVMQDVGTFAGKAAAVVTGAGTRRQRQIKSLIRSRRRRR